MKNVNNKTEPQYQIIVRKNLFIKVFGLLSDINRTLKYFFTPHKCHWNLRLVIVHYTLFFILFNIHENPHEERERTKRSTILNLSDYHLNMITVLNTIIN